MTLEDAEYLVRDFDGMRTFLIERAQDGTGIVLQYV